MTITAEQFAAERHPVRGRSNPERMNKPVWAWLVREEINAWQAAQRFGAPSALEVGPGWCFTRFGCSSTALPDGRVLRIAGEHEDAYDPDFYIYNDLIVRHPDGGIDIYGYPEDVFPPTDFHSATLAGEHVWIVGSLGYRGRRAIGTTQVCRLDLDTFAIETLTTTGNAPGWLHDHTGAVVDGGLVVSRGTVETEDGPRDNIDDWRLDLSNLIWTRLTQRPFQTWSVAREDGEPLMYWELEQLAYELAHPEWKSSVNYREQIGPRFAHFDPDVLAQLFHPPLDHTPVETSFDDDDEDDEADNTRYDTAQVCVGDTLIRYADDRAAMRVKIEGKLSSADTRSVVDDLASKLTQLQGSPCRAKKLG